MRDRKPPAVSEHGGLQLAGAKRRAAARAIDAAVTAVLAFVAVMVAGFAAALVSLSMHGFSGGDDETLYGWLILFSLLALVPVARYEVAATARRGQTFGKRCMGLRVVVWDEKIAAPAGDAESVDARRSIERWAVPHLPGVVVGVLAGVVSGPRFGGWAVLVGADAGLAVWMLVYASSLWDPNGRGWHDKAAGTVVVAGAQAAPAESGDPDRSTPGDGQVPAGSPSGTSRPVAAVQRNESSVGSVSGDEMSMATDRARGDERQSPTAAGGRVVLIVIAVLVAAVSVGGVGGVGYVAVDALLDSFEIDKYDESVRQREDFGQVVGPDGDACWPDHEYRRNGPVLCDLESIGGLHWDTGDVSIEGTTGSPGRAIFVGSGYMCLLTRPGVPWCWEWSTDVQPPRPAQVPQGADFEEFVTADHLRGLGIHVPPHQARRALVLGVEHRRAASAPGAGPAGSGLRRIRDGRRVRLRAAQPPQYGDLLDRRCGPPELPAKQPPVRYLPQVEIDRRPG